MIGLLKKIFSGFAMPKPAGPPKLLASINRNSVNLISEHAQWSGDTLVVNSASAETIRIFEFDLKDAEQCILGLRFEMSTQDLESHSYPEMWLRIPGRGEFFSKGLQFKTKGTNAWSSCELPFFLKAGQKADLLKLNLVFGGAGVISLQNLELYATPLEG